VPIDREMRIAILLWESSPIGQELEAQMPLFCTAQPEQAFPKQYWLGLALAGLLWAVLGIGATLV